MYDSVSHVAMERINEVSQGKYHKPRIPSKTYNGSHFRSHSNSHFSSPHATSSQQFSRNQGRPQFSHTHSNIKCCYCKGKHCIRECDKYSWDKSKSKLKTVEIMQKCKDKIVQKAGKDNISVNEASFSTTGQESVYSVEQVEQLLGNMQFSDSKSSSD